MIGTEVAPLHNGSMSNTTKSIGQQNLSTCTNTSSTIPLGTLIDQSAKDKVIVVVLSSPNPSCLQIEYGRRFTLAPKLSKAFSTYVSPICTEIVRHVGSLYFTGALFSMITLTCLVRNALLLDLILLFTMHKSLRSFA